MEIICIGIYINRNIKTVQKDIFLYNGKIKWKKSKYLTVKDGLINGGSYIKLNTMDSSNVMLKKYAYWHVSTF